MKLFHFSVALIFSAFAVNAFVLPKNAGEDTHVRERRQSEGGWDWNNWDTGRKKRGSGFSEGLLVEKVIQDYLTKLYPQLENDDAEISKDNIENERPAFIEVETDVIFVNGQIGIGENEVKLIKEVQTDFSLSPHSESATPSPDNEDEGSGLQHKSLKKRKRKCKKGQKNCRRKKPCKNGNKNCRRQGKRPCENGRGNCTPIRRKPCPGGVNRNGKCCKKGVKKNGQCKGILHRIWHHIKNKTEEGIHDWIDRRGNHHRGGYDRETDGYPDGYPLQQQQNSGSGGQYNDEDYDDGEGREYEEEDYDTEGGDYDEGGDYNDEDTDPNYDDDVVI